MLLSLSIHSLASWESCWVKAKTRVSPTVTARVPTKAAMWWRNIGFTINLDTHHEPSFPLDKYDIDVLWKISKETENAF